MTGQRYLEAARALAPRIAAEADRIDREKELPPELVDALADAGLFRLLVPRSIGGGELDLPSYVEVVEEIARADASTGWCVNQSAVRATTSAWMEHATARAIFGRDRDATIANGPLPGRAVPVDGGYRLSGHWNFASGCRHASSCRPPRRASSRPGTSPDCAEPARTASRSRTSSCRPTEPSRSDATGGTRRGRCTSSR
jgi:alkylation response protein AidB-like acyl-CoA dehydrogenase